MPEVDILLATYNGAAYLPEQLASLQRQTHSDWRLLVRDDGSTDASCKIVRAWADTVPNDVIIIEDQDSRIGPAQSFGRLLTHSEAPYFAFCDQDDVWHKTKIERLLGEIQRLEASNPGAILVHSDLEVVDASLAPTGKRLWSELKIANPDASQTDPVARASLLMQNVVTGCALLGNAELLRRATPLPEAAHVHDAWVALIAAHFGKVKGLPEPLVKYRQHGANTIGASGWDPVSMIRRVAGAPVTSLGKARALSDKLQRQAAGFLAVHGGDLTDKDRRMIEELATLRDRSLWQRKTFMRRHGAYPQSTLRRLLLQLTL